MCAINRMSMLTVRSDGNRKWTWLDCAGRAAANSDGCLCADEPDSERWPSIGPLLEPTDVG